MDSMDCMQVSTYVALPFQPELAWSTYREEACTCSASRSTWA